MTEATVRELQPGDRIRLRRLPRTHSHLTGKYGVVAELPGDDTAAVVLDGRRDALLVHVLQAAFVARPPREEVVSGQPGDEVPPAAQGADAGR